MQHSGPYRSGAVVLAMMGALVLLGVSGCQMATSASGHVAIDGARMKASAASPVVSPAMSPATSPASWLPPLPASPSRSGAAPAAKEAVQADDALLSTDAQVSQTQATGTQAEQGGPPPLPDFEELPDRWYTDPWALLPPPPYEINEPGVWWNPYRQNRLKGDFPILPGLWDDVFLNTTVTSRYLAEGRRLPTPRGITGTQSPSSSFFGDPDQFQQVYDLVVTFDLFKGQQAFKPVDWRLKGTYVFNVTNLQVEEVGVVDVDPSKGRNRTTNDVAVQELFFESHLFDLTDRFDHVAIEAGLLPFRSDFRGFIFDDTNLGIRLLGNHDNNKWQYNAAIFFMREKDTFSELNTWEDRDQQVFILNVYRQDWPVLGYTTQFSYHFNRDEAKDHFDKANVLVRPAPIGLARPHEIRAHYVGWTGEGHFTLPWPSHGINITHAFYHVFGEDDDNPIAARSVGIRAFFAALEISYDIDWFRIRTYSFFQSGDRDPRDDDAEGFDAILDAPNFAGGELSFFNRQGIKLLGTNLTNRLSPLANLRTSKLEGQSSFVNPGLFLVGAAVDVEVTPETRFQVGGNWMRFHDSDPLETFLQIENIDEEVGFELFAGVLYRPFLNNHILIKVGPSVFWPDKGFKRIYDSERTLYSLFTDVIVTF